MVLSKGIFRHWIFKRDFFKVYFALEMLNNLIILSILSLLFIKDRFLLQKFHNFADTFLAILKVILLRIEDRLNYCRTSINYLENMRYDLSK